MWKDVWRGLRASKHLISLDESHLRDDRNGRYQRALTALGWILALGEPIGFRQFRRQDDFDVCYLASWHIEEYQKIGQYMIFRVYFSKQNYDFHEIGYRKLVAAEIACFYDGLDPNPGRVHAREGWIP